ncbi:MAG: VanZ family protein [Firmicutes bacterium]|nr:VanZ family protein [Bacillota bacterium]
MVFRKKSLLYLVLAIITYIAIFFLSSFDSVSSNKQSAVIKEPIVNFVIDNPSVYNRISGKKVTENTTVTDVTTPTEATTNALAASLVESTKAETTTTVISHIEDGKLVLSKKDKNKLSNDINLFVRKSAHFMLYFLFTLFNALFFISLGLEKYFYMPALLLCLIGGGLDELHQKLGKRSGKVSDVVIDFCGGLLIICILLVLRRVKAKKLRQNKGM